MPKSKKRKMFKIVLDASRESWRPVLAFTMIAILIQYVFVGFFMKIWNYPNIPTLPDQAWTLLSIFAGAYTVSRGVEKFSQNYSYNKETVKTEPSIVLEKKSNKKESKKVDPPIKDEPDEIIELQGE